MNGIARAHDIAHVFCAHARLFPFRLAAMRAAGGGAPLRREISDTLAAKSAATWRPLPEPFARRCHCGGRQQSPAAEIAGGRLPRIMSRAQRALWA